MDLGKHGCSRGSGGASSPAAAVRALVALIVAATIGPGIAAAQAPDADGQLERKLLMAPITSVVDLGRGVTQPKKVTLAWRGKEMHAVFKDINEHSTEATRFRRGPEKMTLTFSDDYRYERAAYLLDRELGLGMVPVAVLRKVDGKRGALIAWIDGAMTEEERRAQGLTPQDPARYNADRHKMAVFDALIFNVDRNLGNRLFTADGAMHLIDHSRAFRLTGDLPPNFIEGPAALPRSLFEALKRLDKERVKTLVGSLLSGQQIRYLMQRRDKILEKVQQDIAKYGEAMVLSGEPAAAG